MISLEKTEISTWPELHPKRLQCATFASDIHIVASSLHGK
jgi:hypothetical protein